VKAALERLHEDDEAALQARDAAEAQFDEADRRMSTSMACQGAQMAVDAWKMRESFIRKAEALARRKARCRGGRAPLRWSTTEIQRAANSKLQASSARLSGSPLTASEVLCFQYDSDAVTVPCTARTGRQIC
jgi:hypothetical protein